MTRHIVANHCAWTAAMELSRNIAPRRRRLKTQKRFLPFCLCVRLSVCLSLRICVSAFLSRSRALSLSLSVSLCPSVPLSLSLSLAVSVSVSATVSVSVSVPVPVSVSVSVSVSLALSRRACQRANVPTVRKIARSSHPSRVGQNQSGQSSVDACQRKTA